MKHARITLAAVLAVLAGLVGLAAGTGAASAKAAATNTTLTLTIANCEGCVVGLTSVMAADYEDLWSSKGEGQERRGDLQGPDRPHRRAEHRRPARPGKARCPTRPWSPSRYKGYTVGEKLSLLRHQPRQEGLGLLGRHDRHDAATLKIVVKKVTVMGNMGPVKGSIAFAKTTQDYLQPMQPTWNGVLGLPGRLRLRPQLSSRS